MSDEEKVSEKSNPYTALDVECLKKRIAEEHDRAIKIDDKTSKFTLGLSVSLTVLAAASGAFAKLIPTSPYGGIVSLACGLSSVYMLLAGITALGALKTLAIFGYGTHHELKNMGGGASYLSQTLYAQERMNIVRQLRNEAAYQSLRNGLIILLFTLVGSVVGLAYQQTSILYRNNTEVEKVDEKRHELSCTSRGKQ
ncbi:hypothetical protein MRB56_12765 [Halomonas cupida]|uniref:hypothetical protein n=1 Tax=Halomonas cupida TaxID=44933 RepID=UPI0039B3FDE0